MARKNIKSKKVAFGGIVTALSVCLMLLGGVIPFLTYSVPILTGLILIMIVVEFGKGWAFAVYVAVSIMSVLFVADKECAIMYVAFFGYYPILKPVIERINIKPLEWIIKFVIFNASLILAYFVLIKVFTLEISSENLPFKYTVLVLLILANILFLIYDIFFTRVVTLYTKFWSRIVKRFFSK